MAVAKIKSIKCQRIMSNEDYEYLQAHLNEELPIMSLNFTDFGDLWSIAVYANDSCISIFLDMNKVDCEVICNGKRIY